MLILLILLVIEGILMFSKVKKAHIVDSNKNTEFNTKEEFSEATKTMLELGYVFNYNPNIIHHSGWDKVKAPYLIHGYNKFLSYDMEIIAAILNIAMFIFSFIQDRKIAHL